MIAGSVTAHGGGVVTPRFFGPRSPARAGGKLIIIVVDNTNREQFIIAPLLPDCVSTSRVARPDTIIQWRGMRRERGGITVEEGRDGEWEKWGLMRFWWCLSRRGSFKHDHLTGSLVWISPSSTPPSLISDCCHSGEVENHQHQLQPPFHILDTSNATVKNKSSFTRLTLVRCNTAIFPTDVTIKHTGNFLYSASKFWANTTWVHSSVLKFNKKQQPSASFRMTNCECLVVQASLTDTTVTGKRANWGFFLPLVTCLKVASSLFDRVPAYRSDLFMHET